MFLLRTAIVISAGIMLMPLDEQQAPGPGSKPGSAGSNAMTFCERHPSTCAAGGELWTTFKKKAEVALVLAVRVAADQMRRPSEQATSAANADSGSVTSGAATQAPPVRGTLTPRDTTPVWRGATARSAS